MGLLAACCLGYNSRLPSHKVGKEMAKTDKRAVSVAGKRAAKTAAGKAAAGKKVGTTNQTVTKTVTKTPAKKASADAKSTIVSAAKTPAVKKAAVKKTAVKKTAVKKTAVKKAAVKKAAAKTAVKKTAVKKVAVKKAAVKKAAVKKTAATKAALKKTAVKKTRPAKKATPAPRRDGVRARAVPAASRVYTDRVRTTVPGAEDAITLQDGRYALPATVMIELPDNYHPQQDTDYMNPRQLEYFRRKLRSWRNDLIEESRQTIESLRDEVRDVGDEAERATRETENSLELRTRDRYRKLIHKIDEALVRIEEGDYGYCDETDEDIGVLRLEARPIATMSLDAQERWEHRQRQMSD